MNIVKKLVIIGFMSVGLSNVLYSAQDQISYSSKIKSFFTEKSKNVVTWVKENKVKSAVGLAGVCLIGYNLYQAYTTGTLSLNNSGVQGLGAYGEKLYGYVSTNNTEQLNSTTISELTDMCTRNIKTMGLANALKNIEFNSAPTLLGKISNNLYDTAGTALSYLPFTKNIATNMRYGSEIDQCVGVASKLTAQTQRFTNGLNIVSSLIPQIKQYAGYVSIPVVAGFNNKVKPFVNKCFNVIKNNKVKSLLLVTTLAVIIASYVSANQGSIDIQNLQNIEKIVENKGMLENIISGIGKMNPLERMRDLAVYGEKMYQNFQGTKDLSAVTIKDLQQTCGTLITGKEGTKTLSKLIFDLIKGDVNRTKVLYQIASRVLPFIPQLKTLATEMNYGPEIDTCVQNTSQLISATLRWEKGLKEVEQLPKYAGYAITAGKIAAPYVASVASILKGVFIG